jgi:hypothetical protein
VRVSTSRPPAGDRLLRAGAIVTVIGILATMVAMLPLVIPSLTLPPAMWFASMIIGIGLAMVIAGFAVSARARGRSARRRDS